MINPKEILVRLNAEQFIKDFGEQAVRTQRETLDILLKQDMIDSEHAIKIIELLSSGEYMYKCSQWASCDYDREYHIKSLHLEPRIHYRLHLNERITERKP